MFRWKSTEQILSLSKDGEIFDENWMNYDSIYQYIPPNPDWKEKRPIRFEDVDIWEVIAEESGPIGVYAAWCPYAEFFVVMKNWAIVEEFSGWNANKRCEEYMILNNLNYPKAPDKTISPFEITNHIYI